MNKYDQIKRLKHLIAELDYQCNIAIDKNDCALYVPIAMLIKQLQEKVEEIEELFPEKS